MKTRLIILTAVAATLLYSCSNDRDEDVRKDAIEAVKNSNQELKLNPKGLSVRGGDIESKSDTIAIRSLNSGPQDPTNSTDPDDSELIPPGDVKPPKGGK